MGIEEKTFEELRSLDFVPIEGLLDYRSRIEANRELWTITDQGKLSENKRTFLLLGYNSIFVSGILTIYYLISQQ